MFSKTFSSRMKRLGATMRECYAAVWGLVKRRAYIHSSPLRTQVYTDCKALTFIKSSTQSELSHRFLAKCAGMRYDLFFFPGYRNVIADAGTRLQLAGQHETTPEGSIIALLDLLGVLPKALRTAKRVWISISEHTEQAYKVVQQWRTLANAMVRSSPTVQLFKQNHDLRILQFPAHTCLEQTRLALRESVPTAVLMPLDLVIWLSIDDNGTLIPEVRDAVGRCKRHIYVGSIFVWLLHKIEGAVDHITMLATKDGAQVDTDTTDASVEQEGWAGPIFDDETTMDSICDLQDDEVTDVPLQVEPQMHYGEQRHLIERLAELVDTDKWVGKQTVEDATKEEKKKIFTDKSGLKYYNQDGHMTLVVPKNRRGYVLRLTHEASNHASTTSLRREVRRRYWWPRLARDCSRWSDACHACQYSKIARVRHHNMYSCPSYVLPRNEMGLDVKQITVNGVKWQILLMVDKFSGFVVVSILPGRKVDFVISGLWNHWYSIFASPKIITVDGAKELVSEKLKGFLKRQGTQLRQPLAGYPEAAGKVERQWQWIEACLRRVTDFSAWRVELQQAILNKNTTVEGPTKETPFELFLGGPAHTAATRPYETVRTTSPAANVDLRASLQKTRESIRQQAAANANYERSASAIKRNRTGRKLGGPLIVGEKVWIWMDIGRGKGKRPRSTFIKWLEGEVTGVQGVRVDLRAETGNRMYTRHRQSVKRRTDALPPPTPAKDVLPATAVDTPQDATTAAETPGTRKVPTRKRTPLRTRRKAIAQTEMVEAARTTPRTKRKKQRRQDKTPVANAARPQRKRIVTTRLLQSKEQSRRRQRR